MPADLLTSLRNLQRFKQSKSGTYICVQAIVFYIAFLAIALFFNFADATVYAKDYISSKDQTTNQDTNNEVARRVVKTANPRVQQHTVRYVPIASYVANNSQLATQRTNPYEKYQGVVSPTETAMIRDAKDDQFNYFTLLDAALIAGGTIDPTQLERYRYQYRRHVDTLAQMIPAKAQPLQVARIILEYLHSEMFKEYLLESSNVGMIFDSGVYNCVTGVTLFNNLARQFGLNAIALELPGHAMSRIYMYDGTYYDVETTCAIWFQLQNYPGRQEQVIARMLEAATGTQVTDKPVIRREINDVELVAKLYYNRGVELLNKNDYVGALNCNAKALVLDPNSETAKGNFLATINNWAITESKAAHYETAVAILHQGLQIDPNYSIFKNNHVHIYHQWIEQKCKAARYDEALELSRQAIAEAPDEEHFRKLESYALMGLRRVASQNQSNPTSEPVTTTVAYPHP